MIPAPRASRRGRLGGLALAVAGLAFGARPLGAADAPGAPAGGPPALRPVDEASWQGADGRLRRLYRPQFTPAPALLDGVRAFGMPGVEWALDPVRARLLLTGTADEVAGALEALRWLDAPAPSALVGVTMVETLSRCQSERGGSLGLDRGAVAGAPETFFRGFRHAFEPDDWVRAQAVGGRPFLGSSALFGNSDASGAFAGLFDMALRALSTSQDAVIVADPVVLCTEGVPAVLSATTKLPVSLFETRVAPLPPGAAWDAAPPVTPWVQTTFEQAGVRLEVVAEVVGRDHVRLRLKPWYRQIAPANQPGASVAAPPMVVREMETVVTVPDGTAIAVGGISGLRRSRDRGGAPSLDLPPVLDAFLASHAGEQFTSEVLFVVKAQVVRPGRPGPAIVPPGEIERLRAARAAERGPAPR